MTTIQQLRPPGLSAVLDRARTALLALRRADAANAVSAVDGHDPPDRMADQVRLRDPVCVFPGCHRRSRTCDLDHINPYTPPHRGGPPGQTHPGNLAPLCRHHHRAKTHSTWHYQRHPDHSYHWTSPTGRTYVVRSGADSVPNGPSDTGL